MYSDCLFNLRYTLATPILYSPDYRVPNVESQIGSTPAAWTWEPLSARIRSVDPQRRDPRQLLRVNRYIVWMHPTRHQRYRQRNMVC